MKVMIGVEDLVVLFAGEPGEGDEWVSAPTFSAKIAEEVARRISPRSEIVLREMFYGDWPVDQIDLEAKQAISAGYAAWRESQRRSQRRFL